LRTQFEKGLDYKTIDFVKQDSTKYFEIGKIISGSENYYCVIGWRFINNNWFKETEVIYITGKIDKSIPAIIDTLRGKWVDYSNAHDPENLIKNIYAEDAVYFSNTRTSFGKEIIQRYNYMTYPNWSIKLTPIKKLRVQTGLVYEIGSYGRGLYFLLWEKTSDGHWKARYDFNF
jgi:ketosteroid isomerase-like protein